MPAGFSRRWLGAKESEEDGVDEEGAAEEEKEEETEGYYALQKVSPTLFGNSALALWVCMATSAVTYTITYGYVKWNLGTSGMLAPLSWWQFGLSTVRRYRLTSA